MSPTSVPPRHSLLSRAAIRELESRALAATPPGALMARAAEAVADACSTLLRSMPPRTPVLALVGPGNNGGDALLAALKLAERGWSVRALALSPDMPVAEDAARARRAWDRSGRPLAAPAALDELLAEGPLVIDGLFGIGLTRPLPAAAAAVSARLAAAGATVLAVDVPSGLDADRGAVLGGPDATCIRAQVTVTMIADKPGLRTGAGASHAGHVLVADLGLPDLGIASPSAHEPAGAPHACGALVDAESAGAGPLARTPDAHKGRFGDVLVIAGAPAMRGASVLAALGAQAVGAGRLYLGVEDDAPADPAHPELMSRRVAPTGGAGAPDGPWVLGDADAVVVGCGLGRDASSHRKLAAALEHPGALVIDADGLNGLSADPMLRARLVARAAANLRTVLTPHPLEAARLLGLTVAEVQGDRIAAATRLARDSGACVVLKGAGTVVAQPEGDWSINASGGPLLAVAGTGDVLAGTIGGLLAGGAGAAQAARFGVWLHGAAADALATRDEWAGGIGLPASRLAGAIRALVNRRVDRWPVEGCARNGPPVRDRG